MSVVLVNSHGRIPQSRRSFIVPTGTTVSFLPEYGTVGIGGIGNKTYGNIVGPKGRFSAKKQSRSRRGDDWLRAIESATGLRASTYRSGERAPNLNLTFDNVEFPTGAYTLPRNVHKRQLIRRHGRGKTMRPECSASSFRDGHYIFAGCRRLASTNVTPRDVRVAEDEKRRRKRRTRSSPYGYNRLDENTAGLSTKMHTKSTRTGVYDFRR